MEMPYFPIELGCCSYTFHLLYNLIFSTFVHIWFSSLGLEALLQPRSVDVLSLSLSLTRCVCKYCEFQNFCEFLELDFVIMFISADHGITTFR